MTTYKELFGKYVQNLSSDPTSTDAEGQIWYNSTSGTFKTALGSYGVWSAGGNLNTARQELTGIGTQSASLAFGGDPARTNSESYNGTSWTATSTLNTGRGTLGGAGTNTAGLAFGGVTTTYSGCNRILEWKCLDNFTCYYEYSKKSISCSWFTNSSFRFWRK